MYSPHSRHALQSGGQQCKRPWSVACALVLLPACVGLMSCTQAFPTIKQVPAPTITTFSANPSAIIAGTSTTLSWTTSGATGITVTPGTFASTSASGSVVLSPVATTTYTLTATNTTGTATATVTVTVTQPSLPSISSFTANPTKITLGGISKLSWATAGANTLNIAPGNLVSNSASGSVNVSPETTTTYVLTATNAAGSVTASAMVTVAAAGGALKITTTSCPGGTQGTPYAGCTIAATGGTPPYTFSVTDSVSYPPLPEGMTMDASSGQITSPLTGGQGTYIPEFVVTDATSVQAKAQISFAINGSNAFLANIFPATSIFHHRVDAAATNLPVDTSPAAPIYSGYLPATIKPFFGNNSNAPFPNGIPAIEAPYNQPDVSVATTVYQSYFNSGPIPAYAPVEGTSNSSGDRHVLVYLEAGNGNNPALYEMWQGIYEDGPWTDSSNALWPNVASNALTPQGQGTSDAAGLPVAPLLANADEVIGAGTPSAPKGTIQHPIRFTLNHMLNYWVWPATQSAGVGSCAAERRWRDSRGVRDFAGYAAGKLHDDGTRGRDLPVEGVGGNSRLRGYESAGGDHYYCVPELWNHSGRQRHQRRADRHARRALERCRSQRA